MAGIRDSIFTEALNFPCLLCMFLFLQQFLESHKNEVVFKYECS